MATMYLNLVKFNAEDFDKAVSLLEDSNHNISFLKYLKVDNHLLDVEEGTFTYKAWNTICSPSKVYLEHIENHISNLIKTFKGTRGEFIAESNKPTNKPFVVNVLRAYSSLYDTKSTALLTDDDYKKFNNILQTAWNYHEFGYSTWYSHNNTVLGCKWDCSDSDIWDENNIITYDTANGIPTPFYRRFHEETGIPFRVFYASDDFGVRYGIIEYVNGEEHEVLCGTYETYKEDKVTALAIATYLLSDTDTDISNLRQHTGWEEDEFAEIIGIPYQDFVVDYSIKADLVKGFFEVVSETPIGQLPQVKPTELIVK